MSKRVTRVNELLKREVSHVLHTRYQEAALGITILEVQTLATLRGAKVFYAVLGDEARIREAHTFLRSHAEEIRREVGKAIVLKFLPHLEFLRDDSVERGARVNALIDSLDIPPEPPPEDDSPVSKE
jgi:ribosome-binding factor A